ncbi:MAG: hypothetical protein PHF59_02480, partial [Bacilli bacterium]|nr:hypothetical protein [Bacilli bacterium]
IMKKNVKKVWLVLTAVIAVGAGSLGAIDLSGFNGSDLGVGAVITSNDVRIAVVRPVFWDDAGAYQPLRIASTEADLTNNTFANITYITSESYTSDTYYVAGGGFKEYDTDGVIFYDVPLATLTGKYFDLARLSTTDESTAAVWNRTAPELFNSSMLHKIWRIWDNDYTILIKGISRPEGSTAESRNVSNVVINSLLYGYLTCSPSTTNGYGAFGALDANFNLTGRTYTEVDTVLDFINEADYEKGRGTGVTVSTSVKVAMMQAMTNSSGMSTLPLLDDKKNLNTILIVGLLGLTTIAGLYISSKKKIKV